MAAFLNPLMTQNGQEQFKNLVANAARFLKCVWPFWDIMYVKVNSREMMIGDTDIISFKYTWKFILIGWNHIFPRISLSNKMNVYKLDKLSMK